jgi:hypothetical protein
MRNGGRHRCQPPLRRALDLPVFPGQLARSHPQDYGAPAQASRFAEAALPRREPSPASRPSLPAGEVRGSSGSAFAPVPFCKGSVSPAVLPPAAEPAPCGTCPFANLRTGSGSCVPNHCFSSRGPSWDDHSLLPADLPEGRPALRSRGKIVSSGASCRLALRFSAKSLPGDACLNRSAPVVAGDDRGTSPEKLALRLVPARAAAPRSLGEDAAKTESHKAELPTPCLWKAGISGATVRLHRPPSLLPFRSLPPNSPGCPTPPHFPSPSPPTSRA